ncbi:MAG: hypothetical protein Q8N36_00835 [bacterium]|nr:hypothetical protein [bacterium]
MGKGRRSALGASVLSPASRRRASLLPAAGGLGQREAPAFSWRLAAKSVHGTRGTRSYFAVRYPLSVLRGAKSEERGALFVLLRSVLLAVGGSERRFH